MTDDVPVSSSAANSSGDLITSLNDNDVILGRGAGPSQFVGNLRFQSRIEKRQEEYLLITAHRHKRKAAIARDIVDQTHALGGRFVKPVGSGEVSYEEVADAKAIEKCKQSFRDCRRKQGPLDENDFRGNSGEKGVGDNMMPLVPSLFFGSMEPPCVEDVHQMLFQSAAFALPQQTTTAQLVATNFVNTSHFNRTIQNRNGARILPDAYPPSDSTSRVLLQDTYCSMNTSAANVYRPYLANNARFSRPGYRMMQQQQAVASAETGGNKRHLGTGEEGVDELDRGNTMVASRPSATNKDVSDLEDDLSDFVLTLLEARDRPVITEEQVELERAAMTDEEKIETLTDIFGRKCAVGTPKSKKARKDLDKNSIAFLVKQMRLELERIPKDRKRALLEAQAKCRADEFSDARLERFLRCEGMNVKLGAQRFVSYWETRRELFGPDKFVLRMTLSGPLCDDLAAVEACTYHPLPHLDASGRQLVFIDPKRHTREGYSSESMVRAVWYVFEVMARENTDIDSGIVIFWFLKDATVWDYDKKLDQIICFFKKCLPLKMIARHVCYPPSVFGKIFKPIYNAVMDKRQRSRFLIHDVPESQLLDVLSDFGIRKEMLPTEIGGTIGLDHAKWMASRRAAELEEI